MTKSKIDDSIIIELILPKTVSPEQKAKDEAYTQMCAELFADYEFLPLAVEDAAEAIKLYALEKALLSRPNEHKDGYQEINIQGKKIFASKEESDALTGIKENRKALQEFMKYRADQFFLDNGVCDPKDVPALYDKLNDILKKNEEQIKKSVFEGSRDSSSNIDPIGLSAPKLAANLNSKAQVEI